MLYTLLICSDGVASDDKVAVMVSEVPAWAEAADARGRLFGEPLADPGAARTVRVRDGETIVTDGPFAETKEFIGGLDLVDCDDLDAAIELAAAHPVSWFHKIEVRPFIGDGEPAGAAALGERLRAGVAPGKQRFLLLVCVDGIPESDEVEASIRQEGQAWAEQAAASGMLLFGAALAGPEAATTVRVREDRMLLTDGPFAETKEFVAGLGIVECAGIEEAIALAAGHPIARSHSIEVRAFEDFDD